MNPHHTPHQALAFRYPLTEGWQFGLNTWLEPAPEGTDKPATMRLPPEDRVGMLKAMQAMQIKLPEGWRTKLMLRGAPRKATEVDLWKVLGWYERQFRVGLCVDATGTGTERFPCWHVSVSYGESPRRAGSGYVGQALPVRRWGALRCKQAEHIMRRELDGVGEWSTETILTRARVLELWREQVDRSADTGDQGGASGGVREPMHLAGRRQLTEDEALACFADRPEILERLNPTWWAVRRELHTLN